MFIGVDKLPIVKFINMKERPVTQAEDGNKYNKIRKGNIIWRWKPLGKCTVSSSSEILKSTYILVF